MLRHTTISAAALLLCVIGPGPAKASDCSHFLDGLAKHGREAFVADMLPLWNQEVKSTGACNVMAVESLIDLNISTCKSGASSAKDAILVPAMLWGMTCEVAVAFDLDPKWTYQQLEECVHGEPGDPEDPEAPINQCVTDRFSKYADRLK